MIKELKNSEKQTKNIKLFSVPNRDIFEIKCSSDVFLLKIDQRIEEIIKTNPRNVTTDYGELTLNMLLLTILEIKCNLDVFLLKIDQRIEEILKTNQETLQRIILN